MRRSLGASRNLHNQLQNMKRTSHTRPRPVLFIHGGGSADDYAADASLVASLQEALGESHAVQYPFLPQEPEPDLGRKKQIGRALSLTGGKVILAGHSLGASMLLKYLSETRSRKQVAGLFLLAAPFWSGDEDWKQGFVLPEGFADKLPDKVPVFLYHCQDDEEVPVAHLEVYARHLPHATVRKLPRGGHQFNNDLSLVARDMQSL